MCDGADWEGIGKGQERVNIPMLLLWVSVTKRKERNFMFLVSHGGELLPTSMTPV